MLSIDDLTMIQSEILDDINKLMDDNTDRNLGRLQAINSIIATIHGYHWKAAQPCELPKLTPDEITQGQYDETDTGDEDLACDYDQRLLDYAQGEADEDLF